MEMVKMLFRTKIAGFTDLSEEKPSEEEWYSQKTKELQQAREYYRSSTGERVKNFRSEGSSYVITVHKCLTVLILTITNTVIITTAKIIITITLITPLLYTITI